jgi:hypothetical protein
MMSSRIASRIVVAVGLAVVFGIGVVSIFVAPAKSGAQNQVAHNAPSPAASTDQTLANSPAPTAAAPDQTAPDASAAAATAPVPPTGVAGPNDANENSASSNDTNVLKPRNVGPHGAQARNHHDKESSSSHGDDRSIRVASADRVKKSSAPPNASRSDLEAARSDGGITSAPSPSAASDTVESSDDLPPPPKVEANPPASEQSDDGSASGPDMDGRITDEVRSSIASLAPGNNIDVKAMSGIVALAGTVPSQSMVEDARQAAQQIAGVKQVDTSALTVSNQ